MALAILGIGTALPPSRVSQEEAVLAAQTVCAKTAEQADLVPLLYRLTGIDTRHMVLPQTVLQDVLDGTQHSGSPFLPQAGHEGRGPTTAARMALYHDEAGKLAVRAARRALAIADLNARALTHLVTVSCSGFRAPGVDVALIKELNLRPTIQRTHVGFMGCHGTFNGLRVAKSIIEADPQARVLVGAVELCSLHYYYGWDPEKMVANALFGDGAAAAVCGPASGAHAENWMLSETGSYLFPNTEGDMTWIIGDHGFEMTLSSRVPELLEKHLRPWIEAWLQEKGTRLDAIKSWALHPGGPRILLAIEKSLNLDRTATQGARDILARCGNMSSPTILFVMEQLQAWQAPRPCVALGFGPGLVAEGMLLR